MHVLPYLARLALADRQLYWLLGLAFLLMCLSKAAGGRDKLCSLQFGGALLSPACIAGSASAYAVPGCDSVDVFLGYFLSGRVYDSPSFRHV